MVLSSQSPRAARGGGYGKSRRGSGGRWKIALLVVVAAIIGYWVLFKDDAPADVAGSNGQSTDTVDHDASNAEPSPSAQPVTDRTAEPERSFTPPAETRRPPIIDDPDDSDDTPAPPPIAAAEEPNHLNGTADNTTGSTNSASATNNTTADDTRRLPGVVAATGEVGRLLREGLDMLDGNQPITGRAQLSTLLLGSLDRLSATDADLIRQRLTDLNALLVFSPEAVPNDPATSVYRVQSGDLLGSIGRRAGVPYQLLEMINGINANRIRVGQPLKLINGPIHARVSKSQFVMDTFVEGTDGTPVFLASFPVGLGANDNTPVGDWVVANGKVENPDWRNPNTNEYFPAGDPNNPIGEYWVPISGTDENTRTRSGFGIHGTIDPDSIGKNLSMGCIRLADADVAMVYNMLTPGQSTVKIVP